MFGDAGIVYNNRHTLLGNGLMAVFPYGERSLIPMLLKKQ